MKSSRLSNNRVVQFIQKSIRLQLVFTFGVCTALGIMAGVICQGVMQSVAGSHWVTYAVGMDHIDDKGREVVHRLLKEPNTLSAKPELQSTVNQMAQSLNVNILLVNFRGSVFMKSASAGTATFSLRKVIESSIARRLEQSSPGAYVSVFPVTVLGQNAYAVIEGYPEPALQDEDWAYIFPCAIGLIVFMFTFFRMTRRKMHYIQDLAHGLVQMSTGDLRSRVPITGQDELASLATHMNQMASKLDHMMEEERRAERTKNELITNVSHDLRTPLTLIMGYLNLLKDGNYESESQLRDFIAIAYGKSEKLKKLIDDLFEYTKITNYGFELHMETVNLGGLLEQIAEEFVSISEQQSLLIVKELPQQPVMVRIDPSQMSRVFDNILNNAFKYSHKPGTIRVSLSVTGDVATVCVENDADPILGEDLNNMFERFYRVDKSRSSKTGGSGLGLAIAKGIATLHGGKIWAESHEHSIKLFVSIPIQP